MLNLIKKLKPNLGRYTPDKIVGMLADDDLLEEIEKANHPKYLYFDEIKDLPAGLEAEKFWALVKAGRKYSSRQMPMQNFNERKFLLTSLFKHNEILFKLDASYAGKPEKLPQSAIANWAVFSAKIEDANIKPKAAIKYLLEASSAKTPALQNAKNAYVLFNNILSAENITEEILLGIAQENRFRNEDERFVYSAANPQMICYIAPANNIFNSELKKLLAFANNTDVSVFIHPIARAIALMFWVIILNPLPKNNYVLALALYCLYLQKNGYTKLAQLNIAAQICLHLKEFSNAITCAAQDDNDYTYFQDLILRMIILAEAENEKQLSQQQDFEGKILPSIQANTGLNKRQSELIYNLQKAKNARTNFSAYMKENKITRKTAADDLKKLEREGYVKTQKIGRNIFYYATPKAELAMNLK